MKFISIACDSCGVDAPDDESCGDPCCGRCSHPPRGGWAEESARDLLAAARYGTDAEPRSTGCLRTDALDVLATGRALAERVLSTRWVAVLAALTYGASIDQVAAAMSLDAAEVRIGVVTWLDEQYVEGIIDQAEYTRLCARLPYPTGGAR